MTTDRSPVEAGPSGSGLLLAVAAAAHRADVAGAARLGAVLRHRQHSASLRDKKKLSVKTEYNDHL